MNSTVLPRSHWDRLQRDAPKPKRTKHSKVRTGRRHFQVVYRPRLEELKNDRLTQRQTIHVVQRARSEGLAYSPPKSITGLGCSASWLVHIEIMYICVRIYKVLTNVGPMQVKCDETKPGCIRCEKAGLTCSGYGPLD